MHTRQEKEDLKAWEASMVNRAEKTVERKIMSTEQMLNYMKGVSSDTPCVVKFNRATPVCPKCWRKADTRAKNATCPKCGRPLEYTCTRECRFVSVDERHMAFIDLHKGHGHVAKHCRTDGVFYIKVGGKTEIFVMVKANNAEKTEGSRSI